MHAAFLAPWLKDTGAGTPLFLPNLRPQPLPQAWLRVLSEQSPSTKAKVHRRQARIQVKGRNAQTEGGKGSRDQRTCRPTVCYLLSQCAFVEQEGALSTLQDLSFAKSQRASYSSDEAQLPRAIISTPSGVRGGSCKPHPHSTPACISCSPWTGGSLSLGSSVPQLS
jgi:hypothetical protein